MKSHCKENVFSQILHGTATSGAVAKVLENKTNILYLER